MQKRDNPVWLDIKMGKRAVAAMHEGDQPMVAQHTYLGSHGGSNPRTPSSKPL